MKKFKVFYSCEMGLIAEIAAKDSDDAYVVAQEMLKAGVWRNSPELQMTIDSETVEIIE